MTVLDFRILGSLEVRNQAGEPLDLGRRKQRLLLAVLLLSRDGAVTADRLVDLLWGEESPPSASANLYTYVSNLRRLLGSRIQTDSGRYLLRVERGELDADRFERAVDEGMRSGDPAIRVERITRALGLWRSDTVLEGLAVPEELRAAAVRLTGLRTAAVDALVDARLALGEHADLVPELEALVKRDPLHEPRWGQLMLALYRSGRQADALATFRRARELIAAELAVEPGPELQRLHRKLLAGDAALTPPETIPAQLPADLTSFTGRHAELDQLAGLLAPEGDCLPEAVVVAAIDGMAGVGKTALATRLAHRVREQFPDGQLFMDLHGHTQGVEAVAPADALERLLRALGVPDEQIPAEPDERAALYRSTLAARRILVVLDNAATAEQVEPLLPGTQGCAALVTSRRRLTGLDSAVPLSLDVLSPSDATALFTRIVGSTRTEDAIERIHEIVELCGHLPLAIRIAAARLRSRPGWTPEHLAKRLRGLTGLTGLAVGERSVAAAFELSYQHLTAEQQHVFRILGLHPGTDFDNYAAAALTGLDIAHVGVVLEDLLDAHMLIQRRHDRYQFHDLLREYASGLAAGEDADGHRMTRLLDYYVHTAWTATVLLYPAEAEDRPTSEPADFAAPALDTHAAAAAWLDTELMNLRAIAGYAAGRDWPAHTVRLSRILYRHLRVRAQTAEAIGVHSDSLRAARRTGDRVGEIDSLRGLGDVHFMLGEYALATDHHRIALELAREIGDPAREADALRKLGMIHNMRGEIREAVERYEESLAICRRTGNHAGERHGLICLAVSRLEVREYASATASFERALDLSRDSGDQFGEMSALHGLGRANRLTGDHDQALRCYERMLDIADRVGNTEAQVAALSGLGQVRNAMGQHEKALDHHRQELEIARRIDDRNGVYEALHRMGEALHAAGRYAEALTHQREALALARRLGQGIDEGRAQAAVAAALHELGHTDEAAANWQQAHDVLAAHGSPEATEVAAAAAEARTRRQAARSGS